MTTRTTSRTTRVPPRWRRAARIVAALGVVVSGVGMLAEVTSALPAGTPAAGGMVMVPATGDSGTTFTLDFTAPPQFCPGDNTASYVWHTFITPASNDPADMVYSASGTPTGEPAFTNNLADAIGVRVRNQLPGLGDGTVIKPTDLSFANAFYSGVTPGDYWVGIACTQPDANFEVQTMRYWAGRITITASPGAGPNNFTYAAAGVQPTTTTTTTTTVAGATTTTTTVPTGGSTTSTSVAGGTTTTTLAGGTTTTTTNPCSTTTSTSTSTSTSSTSSTTSTTNPCVTTTTAVGSGAFATSTTIRLGSSGGSVGGSGSSLASTGASSSTPMVLLWAVLLVIFGRMVILLARPIRVRSDRP